MRTARSRPPEFTAPTAREGTNGDGMGELPPHGRAKAGGEHGTAWVVAQREGPPLRMRRGSKNEPKKKQPNQSLGSPRLMNGKKCRCGDEMEHMYVLLLPIVSVVAVFTFVTVATWAQNRRQERESYYREETYRKILEHGGDSGDRILRLMREEETGGFRRRIEGQRLGGMITTVVGVGVMIFLYAIAGDEPVYLVGIIPLLIGIVLVIYGFFMAPRALARDRSEPDRRE